MSKTTLQLLFLVFSASVSSCVSERKSVSLESRPSFKQLHFMYVARDRDQIRDEKFLKSRGLAGAQVMYSWKDLEQGKGDYDFGIIAEDVKLLEKHKKKLFVQLQDATFLPTNKPVPRYLLESAEFNGGVAAQCRKDGEVEGWVARRWDGAVQMRFHALLAELSNEFDGVIAGINLQETAVGFEECGKLPAGFTPKAYAESIHQNIKALSNSFKKSASLQYANFMPGEWLPWENQGYLEGIFEEAANSYVGVGGPDLLPGHKGQEAHALQMIRKYTTETVTSIAVQSGNYHGVTGTNEIPEGDIENRVPELYDYAKLNLKVDYVFWVKQEPYFTQLVVPFLNGLPKEH